MQVLNVMGINFGCVSEWENQYFGLRGAKLAILKSPPRLRHSIPLKSSRFSRRSFLDQGYMIMCGPVSSNKVKWTGTSSKVAKKTGIYLDVQVLLTASWPFRQ
jgi:hypothetical protein